jgi:hypothetical protein
MIYVNSGLVAVGKGDFECEPVEEASILTAALGRWRQEAGSGE